MPSSPAAASDFFNSLLILNDAPALRSTSCPYVSSAADVLPGGEGWQFEPKWDGFRTLVFRDGDEILLQSRDEKPMNRYFPELIAPLAATLPERCVADGE